MKNEKFDVLVADNELAGRKNLAHLLREFLPWMNLVGEAASVQETIVKVHQLRPQYLIVDLNLGDGLGFEVVEALSTLDLTVVMTTGYSPQLVPAYCKGKAKFLLKPVGPQDLIQCFNPNLKPEESNNLKQLKGQRFALTSQNQCQLVAFSEIVGIEHAGGQTICHLSDDTSLQLKG